MKKIKIGYIVLMLTVFLSPLLVPVNSWGLSKPQVSAGMYHTAGLKSDGTLVAVGYNSYGQCDVTGWTDIAQVSAGMYHTISVENT